MIEPLFNFDSQAEQAAGGDAFALYRDLYSQGADTERLGDGFHAVVQAWRLDRLILFDRRLAQVAHRRTAARIKRDGFDHFTIQLVIDGVVFLDTGKGEIAVQPGEIVIQNTAKPAANRIERAHFVTASVARNVLEAALGGVSGLHGRHIQVEQAELFADFMASLVRRAPAMRPEDLPGVSRAFVELFTIAVGDTDFGRGGDLNRLEFARREAVRRYIEMNLTDTELSAQSIADATGISRATLYRIFAANEGVGRVITQRRLLSLRSLLDEVHDDRTLAELSNDCGFRSESHMSRQFRDIYGQAPGEYRQLVRQASTPREEAALARDRWAAWMTELQ